MKLLVLRNSANNVAACSTNEPECQTRCQLSL